MNLQKLFFIWGVLRGMENGFGGFILQSLGQKKGHQLWSKFWNSTFAVWPGAKQLTFQCLSFLICKMGTTTFCLSVVVLNGTVHIKYLGQIWPSAQALGECQSLCLVLEMADSIHHPSIYPHLICLKKTGSGEIACSLHNLCGYRVCGGCLGKPFGYRSKRAGRRDRNESTKLKGNIEKNELQNYTCRIFSIKY